MNRDEIGVGTVIFLFGGITAVLSLRMPIGTFRMGGPGLFPLCLGIILMILSGAFILKIFFQSQKGQVKKEASIGKRTGGNSSLTKGELLWSTL